MALDMAGDDCVYCRRFGLVVLGDAGVIEYIIIIAVVLLIIAVPCWPRKDPQTPPYSNLGE
jgi:hypothetical protein